MVIQQKTKKPVQFELLEPARTSLLAWLERRGGSLENYAVPSRVDHSDHLSTRQYARLVEEWVTGIGLRREDYGTHSLRRTKASITVRDRLLSVKFLASAGGNWWKADILRRFLPTYAPGLTGNSPLRLIPSSGPGEKIA
jgi:hypothetical protein